MRVNVKLMPFVRCVSPAAILLAILIGAAPPVGVGKLSGRRAPGFSLPDSRGTQFDLADYRGKVVLLDFMKTQCPACVTLSGLLEQMKARYGDRIVVLSVVIMPDTPANVQQYIQQNRISSPILFDCGQMTASYLKITPANPTVRFPHLFLIDGEGQIRNDFDHDDAGQGKVTARLLSDEIDRLFAGGTEPKKR